MTISHDCQLISELKIIHDNSPEGDCWMWCGKYSKYFALLSNTFLNDNFTIQLYMRVDTPPPPIEIWHSPSTRTTASPIALQFDTGVKHHKVHTTNCQWLDKHFLYMYAPILWNAIYPWIIVRLISNCAQTCSLNRRIHLGWMWHISSNQAN